MALSYKDLLYSVTILLVCTSHKVSELDHSDFTLKCFHIPPLRRAVCALSKKYLLPIIQISGKLPAWKKCFCSFYRDILIRWILHVWKPVWYYWYSAPFPVFPLVLFPLPCVHSFPFLCLARLCGRVLPPPQRSLLSPPSAPGWLQHLLSVTHQRTIRTSASHSNSARLCSLCGQPQVQLHLVCLFFFPFGFWSALLTCLLLLGHRFLSKSASHLFCLPACPQFSWLLINRLIYVCLRLLLSGSNHQYLIALTFVGSCQRKTASWTFTKV